MGSSAQINTIKIVSKPVDVDSTRYDSTENALTDNIHRYIGQELYLVGLHEKLQEFGYRGFVIDYRKDIYQNQNIYKHGGKLGSKYSEMQGKYFAVLEIIKHPRAADNAVLFGTKYFLKLQMKSTNDIIYYEYDTRHKSSFPFVVVGFFEKEKKAKIGTEFIITDKMLAENTNILTGKGITQKTGQKWKCIDLAIEEKYYQLSLVFENSIGERTTISDGLISPEYGVYTTAQAENYRTKFGKENFNVVLQGKVRIGMTKEMCALSWGQPKKINETLLSGRVSEQWVYNDNYLYFENGVLTALQN